MPSKATTQALRGAAGGATAGRQLGVILVDPMPLFREGLSALVNQTAGLHWIGATPNAQAAIVMRERLRPDVVLVDSGLDPRGQLCRLLTSSDSNLTVISLVRDPCRNTAYIQDATAAGVQGILLRTAEPAQVLEAIRRSHLERHFLDPGLSALAGGVPGGRHAGSRQPLSRREYQVLELIADGLDNQSIGKVLFVSVETVRTHVKSILRKLRARDRAHAVSLAYRIGVLTIAAEPCQPVVRTPRPEHPANGLVRHI
ncbi:MAG: LuxR C-terminal-related transcriptional regulator [Sciscionella sp.]